jgi:hypothetical protein
VFVAGRAHCGGFLRFLLIENCLETNAFQAFWMQGLFMHMIGTFSIPLWGRVDRGINLHEPSTIASKRRWRQ